MGPQSSNHGHVYVWCRVRESPLLDLKYTNSIDMLANISQGPALHPS